MSIFGFEETEKIIEDDGKKNYRFSGRTIMGTDKLYQIINNNGSDGFEVTLCDGLIYDNGEKTRLSQVKLPENFNGIPPKGTVLFHCKDSELGDFMIDREESLP